MPYDNHGMYKHSTNTVELKRFRYRAVITNNLMVAKSKAPAVIAYPHTYLEIRTNLTLLMNHLGIDIPETGW